MGRISVSGRERRRICWRSSVGRVWKGWSFWCILVWGFVGALFELEMDWSREIKVVKMDDVRI